jgi:hypothetical protein
MKPFILISVSLVLVAGVLTALILNFGEDSKHQSAVAPHAPANPSGPLRPTLLGEAMDTTIPASRPHADPAATRGSLVSSGHSQSPAAQSLAGQSGGSPPAPSALPLATTSHGSGRQTASVSPSREAGASVGAPLAGGGTSVAPLATDGFVYEIDPGVKAPVALAGTGEPLPPPQAAAIEQIGQEFDRAVAAGGDTEEAWEAARKAADERYRLLFGDEAFNQKTIREAREALEAGRAANP